MEKTGWQVTALAFGTLCAGLALALGANKAALAETERQLENARNAKRPETVTVTEIQREPCPFTTLPATDPNTQCRGGVLLKRTATGWESVTNNGKAVRCY